MGMRLLASRSGALLVGLDVALLLAGWAGVIAAGVGPVAWRLAVVLPAMQVAMLYALGLHRRDAMLDVRMALGRLPLVAALAIGGGWAECRPAPAAAPR